MNVLAIETTTSVCSVALISSDDNEPKERRSSERSHHSENLFEFTQALLKQNQLIVPDLDALVVSSGPGSYTGLRIAASGVKGLLFDRDIPLFAVNTLAGFALGGVNRHRHENNAPKRIHAVLDARRKHLYHQLYTFNRAEIKSEAPVKITPIKEIETLLEPGDMIVGTGIQRLEEGMLEQIMVEGPSAITAVSLLDIYHKGVIQEEQQWQPFIKKVTPAAFEPEYLAETQTGS